MLITDVDDVEMTSRGFVERVDFEIGFPCFEWVGHRHRFGYGQFCLKTLGRYKPIQAHRLAFLLHNDYLPDELSILHSCDNRGCVNPFHLNAGTYSDNAIDRESKGRGVDNTGENNGRALLNWSIVRAIRSDKANGVKTKDIFSKYPLFKQRTIETVLYGTHWVEG